MIHSERFAAEIYGRTRVSGKTFAPINALDAGKLRRALTDDAKAVAHASLATFFEGVGGVSQGRFTWSTIKLYYSVFYSCRALLMLRALTVFYIGHTPHCIKAVAGKHVSKKSGNSHTVIFSEFRLRFGSDPLLSQSIGLVDPLVWLEELRNFASYKTAPFQDPDPPNEYVKPFSKLRAHIQAYLGSDKILYCFDPEHALICYPLWVLSRLSTELGLTGDQRIRVSKHYVKLLIDGSCFIPELSKELKSFWFL